MAPAARGVRARGRAGRGRAGSNARGKRKDDGILGVYKDLIREERAGPSAAEADGDQSQPRKRPKRAGQRPQRLQTDAHMSDNDTQPTVQVPSSLPSSPLPPPLPTQTTIDEDESELEFEDVELGGTTAEENTDDEAVHDPMKNIGDDFSVTVKTAGKNTPARARRKRRPVTSEERQVRLVIHKMHVCYLLYHGFYRNHWCNDEVAQHILKPIANNRIVQLLNPDPRGSDSQRTTFFMLGLNELCDLFHARYKITSLGLHRPQWLAESAGLQNFELNERTEKPLELADFRRAATSMSGSADMGAQLFCCLLRTLGVETRLVFSLQPLGFASAADLSPPSATTTPLKKTLYLHDLDDAPKGPTTANVDDVAPKRITRIGQPRTIDTVPLSTRSLSYSDQSSRTERPSYPVFWVEALNTAHQKWVAVDALCTHTVGKPSRLEPGINDVKNSLTYVIAYEKDGVSRDVTRRYTKAFAAKTRKLRVESTEHGQAWLRKAMTLFRRPKTLDRDAQEDAELTAKAAQEGMPKNVADFRGHPLYALERHIRRNEVIHPKVESGKINVGTAMKPRFELVYRRQNVHVVKSADKWFRLGREVKVGEVPLKTSMPRRGTRAHQSPMEEDEEVPVGVGMYAVFQTQLYVPPPITRDGMVPRNRYGNIDVYVPSMIPEGGVWVRMPEAKHAAKLLKIDYADAVTGFDFKGRHGTARIDGVVVAEQHFEAMEQTCDALREGREEDLLANRRREAVRMWKRFLVGLREVDRIDGYLRDADKVEALKARERNDTQEEEDGGAGGFVADEEDGARSARRTRSQHIHSQPLDSGGGFLAESGDESDGGGGFLADSSDGDDGSGGGFVPDDDDEGEGEGEGGGGFFPDRKDTTFRIAKSQELGGEKEDTNKRTTDDNPFGFANIRIPQLGKSISERAQDRDVELPRIVRGIRRPQQSLLEAAEDIDMMDDSALAHNASEDTSTKAVTKSAPHASVQPEECDQVSVADLNINGTESQAVPEAETKDSQDEAGQANSVTGSPSASRSAVGAVVNTAANTAIQSEDELPKSSYEYDDDLLDEDPEDADAEPEWLL